MILQKTFTNYPEASGLMQELFELSRFLSGSEFLQQEHGKQKMRKRFAPELKNYIFKI
jgi:truncated hemoglobin YjbI